MFREGRLTSLRRWRDTPGALMAEMRGHRGGVLAMAGVPWKDEVRSGVCDRASQRSRGRGRGRVGASVGVAAVQALRGLAVGPVVRSGRRGWG